MAMNPKKSPQNVQLALVPNATAASPDTSPEGTNPGEGSQFAAMMNRFADRLEKEIEYLMSL